ncbi:MAG: hypothetical protein M0Z49_07060, partial [Chloroflexi bacterium]|nr:hypothetical protein [Chloroflexota bacterium]
MLGGIGALPAPDRPQVGATRTCCQCSSARPAGSGSSATPGATVTVTPARPSRPRSA